MPVDRLSALTKRQREVFDFIRTKIFQRGYGPTVRETADAFGIRSPNGVMCHLRALEKKNIIRREPNMSRAIQLINDGPSDTGMPLVGVIAAGRPIEAIEQDDRISFRDMFGKPGLFALEVRGDSMIEDQIAEGDYVVVKKTETARDGQIVVALLGDGDATLKRFFREGNRVRLEPANRNMKPIYARNVRIMGVVVGVVRKYS
jgi:repressor LexA